MQVLYSRKSSASFVACSVRQAMMHLGYGKISRHPIATAGSTAGLGYDIERSPKRL